jgi:hypothetical protein
MAVWVPCYAATWGWRNFLALCDAAVALICVGIWRASPLLLSSQALAAVMPAALWTSDVTARLTTGRHLFGGTEYMWDAQVALPVRLLSLFHLLLPVVAVAALRRTGYDRRGLALQVGITAGLLVASRLLTDGKNLNYALTDPLWRRSWGPAPVHLVAILVGTTVLVYLPTHFLLGRLLPAPSPEQSGSRASGAPD